jgi:heme-degrading monooxygenase HmoA
MRFVRLSVKPEALQEYVKFFEEVDSKALHKIDGCLFAGLIRAERNSSDCIALTLWKSADHARAYEESGQYAKLLDDNRPFLIDSSEWRVQLSDDLTLQYAPVESEPQVDTFEVTASTEEKAPTEEELSHMFLRITSANVQAGKVGAFGKIYTEKIIPALKQVDGFRHAFLVESTQDASEVLSVTVWESREKADEYEKSGRFSYLVDEVKPLLSSLYQWKFSLDSSKKDNVVTSDDLRVEGFEMLTGD